MTEEEQDLAIDTIQGTWTGEYPAVHIRRVRFPGNVFAVAVIDGRTVNQHAPRANQTGETPGAALLYTSYSAFDADFPSIG